MCRVGYIIRISAVYYGVPNGNRENCQTSVKCESREQENAANCEGENSCGFLDLANNLPVLVHRQGKSSGSCDDKDATFVWLTYTCVTTSMRTSTSSTTTTTPATTSTSTTTNSPVPPVNPTLTITSVFVPNGPEKSTLKPDTATVRTSPTGVTTVSDPSDCDNPNHSGCTPTATTEPEYDSGLSPSSSAVSTGVVIGIVVAVVLVIVLVVIIVVVVICLRRRRKRKDSPGEATHNQVKNLSNPVYANSGPDDVIHMTPPPPYELVADPDGFPVPPSAPLAETHEDRSWIPEYGATGSPSTIPPNHREVYSQVQEPGADPEDLTLQDNTNYHTLSGADPEDLTLQDNANYHSLSGPGDNQQTNGDVYSKATEPRADPDDLQIQENSTYHGFSQGGNEAKIDSDDLTDPDELTLQDNVQYKAYTPDTGSHTVEYTDIQDNTQSKRFSPDQSEANTVTYSDIQMT